MQYKSKLHCWRLPRRHFMPPRNDSEFGTFPPRFAPHNDTRNLSPMSFRGPSGPHPRVASLAPSGQFTSWESPAEHLSVQKCRLTLKMFDVNWCSTNRSCIAGDCHVGISCLLAMTASSVHFPLALLLAMTREICPPCHSEGRQARGNLLLSAWVCRNID